MAFFCAGAGVVLYEFLDGVPGVHVYERITVMLDHKVAEFKDANVDAVGEEGLVGVEGGEDLCFGVDLGEGAASGAHLEGALDAGDEFWIWDPAVGDVG